MTYLTAETLSLNAYSPFCIEKHLAYLQLSLVRSCSSEEQGFFGFESL
jgi:hypothetical protein